MNYRTTDDFLSKLSFLIWVHLLFFVSLFIIFAALIPQKSTTLETDNDILYRLTKGDPDAFEAIFWKYNAKVYNFVMSILYDKTLAQDLTQSVFMSIWEHRHTIDPTKNFSAYVYTIAQNHVYRQTEKMLLAYRYEEYVQKSLPARDITIEEKLDSQFLENLIWELIEQLPPSRREIFLLSRKQGLSNKEIADRLSISEKTVETQITRSIHFLKKHLQPHVALGGILFFLQ